MKLEAPFAPIPNFAASLLIQDRTAYTVYGYLRKIADFHSGSVKVYRATLAERLGCSVATVARALAKLRRLGLLQRVRSWGRAVLWRIARSMGDALEIAAGKKPEPAPPRDTCHVSPVIHRQQHSSESSTRGYASFSGGRPEPSSPKTGTPPDPGPVGGPPPGVAKAPRRPDRHTLKDGLAAILHRVGQKLGVKEKAIEEVLARKTMDAQEFESRRMASINALRQSLIDEDAIPAAASGTEHPCAPCAPSSSPSASC